MKKHIITGMLLLFGTCLPSFAWSPKDLFRGKTGFVLSVAAVTAANALDYHWTVQDVYSGAGHEANPIFLNNQGVLDKDRLLSIKIGSGALIGAELLVIRHHPRYRPLMIEANYAVGAALGFQAYHNQNVFNTRGRQ